MNPMVQSVENHPTKTNPSTVNGKFFQLICAKISTIQKDAHCPLFWGEGCLKKTLSSTKVPSY